MIMHDINLHACTQTHQDATIQIQRIHTRNTNLLKPLGKIAAIVHKFKYFLLKYLEVLLSMTIINYIGEQA